MIIIGQTPVNAFPILLHVKRVIFESVFLIFRILTRINGHYGVKVGHVFYK